MNLQNEIENTILDNYVALFRHAIGDKRLFVGTKMGRPKLPPELKELWKKELRTCKSCKIIKFYPRYFKQKNCGNRDKKEGCAYLNYRLGVEKGTKYSRKVATKNKRVGMGNYE